MNLPAIHLHLIFKGGQAISTSTARDGVDLSASIIGLKHDVCRLLSL